MKNDCTEMISYKPKSTERFMPRGNMRHRPTEVGCDRQLGEVHRVQHYTFVEADKHAMILAADTEAAYLCSQGKSLYGNARIRWIAGRVGVTPREVSFILR